jgi:amidophosphoribosyltransferase
LSHNEEQSDRFHEACAALGIWGFPDAAQHAARALLAMQHRGQESTGIVTIDGGFHRFVAAGLVPEVLKPDVLSDLPGNYALGHNRYATSGASGGVHCGPTIERHAGIAVAINGNLPDTSLLAKALVDEGIDTSGLNDTEMMSNAIALYKIRGLSVDQAVLQAYPLFEGAFSGIALDEKTRTMVAFRDECGLRPLSIGRRGDGWVVASETCAFSPLGAQYVRDVEPGEMVVIDQDGLHPHQVIKARPHFDIFELIYFAAPDSVMLGKSIHSHRMEAGRRLAQEQPADADIVVPIPNSAKSAAAGYAQVSGMPLDEALLKNPYIHRTFILPTQELRDAAIRDKFRVIKDSVDGKRVVLIDDSVVRGSTTRNLAMMLREAGASEVHLRISSPPIKYPHIYGVDLKSKNELIAANYDLKGIRKQLRVDSIGYLSLESLVAATGYPASRFDLSPFNGEYSTPTHRGPLR